jgi:putative transposase
MTAIFGYALAVCAGRYGVEVHAGIALGNHIHLVITDVRGELGEFLRELHSFTARCINRKLKRCENVWAACQTSAVELADSDAVMEKLVYCLANAVSSGLVASHQAWPGFHTCPKDVLKRPRVYKRPAYYFAGDTAMPDRAALVVSKPRALSHLTDAEYADALSRRLRAVEANFGVSARAGKHPFLGVAAILSQDPFSSPSSPATTAARSPTVATRDKPTRIAKLEMLATFRRLYSEARDLWRQGVRDALFPPGTYQLLRQHRVCIAPAPT